MAFDWEGRYKSPLELTSVADSIAKRVNEEIDNWIYEVVCSFKIGVDKDELVKALKYDRNQFRDGYLSGYADGAEDALNDITRCKDCRWYEAMGWCGCHHFKIKEDGYCSYGRVGEK